MRTLCDACESAAAIVFCAADEAALCRSCDEKVFLFFSFFLLLLALLDFWPSFLYGLVLCNLDCDHFTSAMRFWWMIIESWIIGSLKFWVVLRFVPAFDSCNAGGSCT